MIISFPTVIPMVEIICYQYEEPNVDVDVDVDVEVNDATLRIHDSNQKWKSLGDAIIASHP